MALLKVEKLTKCFYSGLFRKRKRTAVREVSFHIEAGQTLGLIGESGSGKSTIARLMMGLLRPTAGRIIFNGTEISDAKEKRLKPLRKEMQIVFQNPETALNPKMKLKKSIAEPLRIHRRHARKTIRRKAAEMAQRLDLNEELLDRYPHQLSGGQIQRAVLARLLCLNPRLIILDEPTSMLDVSYQAQILNLLKELQQASKIAYLFISHDIEVISYMSDRVGVLHKGELVDYGTRDRVLNAPRHPYARHLITADRQTYRDGTNQNNTHSEKRRESS